MSSARRHAVWLLVVPLAVNALTGVYLAGWSPPTLAEQASDPDGRLAALAAAVDTERRLVGALLSAFCAVGLVVVWLHRQRPDGLTRVGVALVPAGFGAVALVMALAGADLAAYYAVLTVLAALGAAALPAGRAAGAAPAAA